MTYTLTVAPWVPPQVCAHPEMSGPMSAAWREAAPAIARRTRWAHLVTLVAERNAARHLSTYPRAYVAPIGERTGSAPAVLTDTLVGPIDRDFRDAHTLEQWANLYLSHGCSCEADGLQRADAVKCARAARRDVNKARGQSAPTSSAFVHALDARATGLHAIAVRLAIRCEHCASIGAPTDVLVRQHLQVRPDRATIGGVPRIVPRRRYRANPRRNVTVWAPLLTDDTARDLPRWARAIDGASPMEYACQLTDAPFHRVTLLAVTIDSKRTLIGCPGMNGSIGRRMNVTARTHVSAHKARTSKRASTRTPGAAKSGPARSPWSLTARSLPARWLGVVKDGVRISSGATPEQRALSALWTSILTETHLPDDGTNYVTVGTVQVTRDGPARVMLNHGTMLPMGIIEASRRLALAGEMPD